MATDYITPPSFFGKVWILWLYITTGLKPWSNGTSKEKLEGIIKDADKWLDMEKSEHPEWNFKLPPSLKIDCINRKVKATFLLDKKMFTERLW